MWLRGEQNDGHDDMHFCDLPDLSKYGLADRERIRKWRWLCPICGHVYRIDDYDGPIGSMYEWVRLWPWSERRWQKRSGMVF